MDILEKRAERTASLVQMGEISFGRLALEGVPLVFGSRATRDALSDPVRRPPQAREDFSEEVRAHLFWTRTHSCNVSALLSEPLLGVFQG